MGTNARIVGLVLLLHRQRRSGGGSKSGCGSGAVESA